MADQKGEWLSTACNLCYANCGIQVQIGGENDRHIVRVKGDKNHPASKGYTCNKALQIDHYVNGRDRLTSPLRRRDDGTFEEIDWDTAITEVAEKMAAIRDAHGGDKIFRYGGGGQGNHLGGAYFSSVQSALGMKYRTNALAQEKTGYAWMMARMFGANIHGEVHDAQAVVIIGKNPWQSNGYQRARVMIRQIAKNPNRTLIVLDPRLSETAEFADIHLAVTPGRDAWCLSAMIAHIVQNDLVPAEWLDEHTNGFDAVRKRFEKINVAEYAKFAGVEPELVIKAAEAVAHAETAASYEDLGVQMAPHSTLNSYLNMLMMAVTGNFGKEHTSAPITGLIGDFFGMDDVSDGDAEGYESGFAKSPVAGERIVGGLVPCNTVPDEILTDHPNRYRAMWIESGNPAHSMADSHKWREALRELDLVVVMDVAMTETAREADYILPSPSQYEKWEATFFNFEYPNNVHHLRKPVLEPLGNLLPEPEIHSRIVEALGVVDPTILTPLKKAAEKGLAEFSAAAMTFFGENPGMFRYLSHILYRTLGPTLPEGAASAAIYWGLTQRFVGAHADSAKRAGHEGEGPELALNLFNAILTGRSGTIFATDTIEQSFDKIRYDDKKIRMNIGEMLDEVDGLADQQDLIDLGDEYAFILAAGERRSYTANTAIRDPAWRKSNDSISMSVNPTDAAGVGVADGGRARLVTKAGSAEVVIAYDERMKKGTLSLPNGLGLLYPDAKGEDKADGVSVNELTSLEYKDKFLGTPFHKYVPARLESL
jgi:anaerobic selenocysteine-containing dehydrogenase